MLKVPIIILGGIGLLFWIGCTSKSKNDEKGSETTNSSTNSQTVETNYDTVNIANMKFNPANIMVKRGDTLVFLNNDIVSHNVTEKDSLWQSQTLNPGDSWKYAPDKSYDYFCSLHMVMKGKITVE